MRLLHGLPLGLGRSLCHDRRWEAGNNDAARDDVSARRLDRGPEVLDIAAAEGDVQAAVRNVELSCPGRETPLREVLDDLVVGDVHALEDRRQDVPSPSLRMNCAGYLKTGFVLAGVHSAPHR